MSPHEEKPVLAGPGPSRSASGVCPSRSDVVNRECSIPTRKMRLPRSVYSSALKHRDGA